MIVDYHTKRVPWVLLEPALAKARAGMTQHGTWLLLVLLLGFPSFGLAKHFVENKEVYYLLKKEQLKNANQKGFEHFPDHVVVGDPDNPKHQVTLKPFATQLCATQGDTLKAHKNENTWNQLKKDGVVSCTQNILYGQGGGLDVGDGYLTGVSYTVWSEKVETTVSEKTFQQLARYPTFWQLPIRGDRMKTFLADVKQKVEDARHRAIKTLWTSMLLLLERDIESKETLRGLSAWIRDPNKTDGISDRIRMKYAFARGILGLSFVYQQLLYALKEKNKTPLEKQLEKTWVGLSPPLSFVSDMLGDIRQWQEGDRRPRSFRKSVLRILDLPRRWHSFEGCTPDPSGPSGKSFFEKWQHHVMEPWLCQAWHLIRGVYRNKLGRGKYPSQAAFETFVKTDIISWVKSAFKSDAAIHKALASIQADRFDEDPMRINARPWVMFGQLEQRIKRSTTLNAEMEALDDEIKRFEDQGVDLKSIQLSPVFLKNKSEADLKMYSVLEVGTFAEQARSRLLGMTKRYVLDPKFFKTLKAQITQSVKDPINFGWVQDKAVGGVYFGHEPELFRRMSGYVPRILSVLRHTVLSHVYQRVLQMGVVSAAQKKFLAEFINASVVLNLLFRKKELHRAVIEKWVAAQQRDKVTDRLRVSKSSSFVNLGAGADYVSDLVACYTQDSSSVWVFDINQHGCAAAIEWFKKGVVQGLEQVAWLLRIYKELVNPEFLRHIDFNTPVSEDTLVYDWKKGPFVVDVFENTKKQRVLTVAQEKNLRPFEVQKASGDFVRPPKRLSQDDIPKDRFYSDRSNWRRMDLRFDQVSLCRVGQPEAEFCVQWKPKAFSKLISGKAHRRFEWFRSPVGLLGQTAWVEAKELRAGSGATGAEFQTVFKDLVSPQSTLALNPNYDEHHLYWWSVSQKGKDLKNIKFGYAPPTVARLIDRSTYDKMDYRTKKFVSSHMPRILKVHSKSFSPDGQHMAHVVQYFVIYEPRVFIYQERNGARPQKHFDEHLHMLSSTRITIQKMGQSNPTYSYSSQWQRFLYPNVYGYRDWTDVDRLMYHFVQGFQETPFQDWSHTKRFRSPNHQVMSTEEEAKAWPHKYYPKREREIHDLRVRKWHPFSHHHTWMDDHTQVTLNVGGHVYVVNEKGIRYRSDNFDEMGSRFVATPLSGGAVLGGSRRVDPTAKILKKKKDGKDPSLARLKEAFGPFYHLPFGLAWGFMPEFDWRHWLAGKVTNVLAFGAALPKLWWQGTVKFSYKHDLKLKWTEGLPYLQHYEAGKPANPWEWHTGFPQIKMAPTMPYYLETLSEHDTYWDLSFRTFNHLKGVRESYRIYSAFQDDGVEVLWGDGRFVLVHVRARSDQLHFEPDNLWFPQRSYFVFIPLEVLQAHPNILQVVGWHEGGGGPFHVFHASKKEIKGQYDCVGRMPFCRYNPRTRAIAVGKTSMLFSYTAFPAEHIELAKKAKDEAQSVFGYLFGTYDDALQGYEEEYGSLSKRYQQYLSLVDGFQGTGISKIPYRKLIWLGEGLKGSRLTVTGEDVSVPWINVVEAIAVSGETTK